jgi:hypothetical protein
MRKEKKYHYIYKTTNLKNGKFYVGMHSTNNLNDGYLGSGTRLRRSIRRNGTQNFKLEILEFLPDRISLKFREKQLITENLLKDPMCMNLTLGGSGGCYGEAAMKWSKAGILKRKWLFENDENWKKNKINKHKIDSKQNPRGIALTKEGGGKYWIGKKHKSETIEKMKNHNRQTAEKNSQFGSQWITNGEHNKKIKMMGIVPTGWRLGRTTKKIHI